MKGKSVKVNDERRSGPMRFQGLCQRVGPLDNGPMTCACLFLQGRSGCGAEFFGNLDWDIWVIDAPEYEAALGQGFGVCPPIRTGGLC